MSLANRIIFSSDIVPLTHALKELISIRTLPEINIVGNTDTRQRYETRGLVITRIIQWQIYLKTQNG